MGAADLVKTPNGTFVTKEVAKAAGLEVKAERKPAAKKAPAKRKAATAASKSPKRKASAGASRKGK